MSTNPYDDLDDNTLDDPFAAVEGSSPKNSAKKPKPAAGTFNQPPIIDANSDWDDADGAGLPDDDDTFDDFTPRRVRFAAPAVEDVMADGLATPRSGEDKAARRAEASAKREEDKRARAEQREQEKEAKLAEKQARQQEKERLKAEKEAEKERKRAERQERKEMAAARKVESGDASARGGNRAVLASAAGVLVVAGLAFAGLKGLGILGGDDEDPATHAAVTEAATTAAPSPVSEASEVSEVETSAAVEPKGLAELAGEACKKSGGTSEQGDGATAEGAIKAFNHAYYTQKSAAEAVKFLDKAMYESEDALQQGIDHPGNGDFYCLKIDKGAQPNVFNVTLTEFLGEKAGELDTRETKQGITVGEDGGSWKVKKITVG